MNTSILRTDVQEFIKNNWDVDIMSILLKESFFVGVSQSELAEQLEAKKKCRDKLPTWFGTPNIYYPNKHNIEQTSSERTARYKTHLVEGKTLLDSTGGLGVDSYFFSKKIGRVFHCEMDKNLSQIASHNFKVLGVKNTVCIPESSKDFLAGAPMDFDWIFIDPSRRNGQNEKVFLLKHCVPNVPELLPDFFKKTKNILLKSSPLLDIKQGISELTYVKEVHVVAVKNEVKEVLWVLKRGFRGEIVIRTTNLGPHNIQRFDLKLLDEHSSNSKLKKPQTYLYEPNGAILKAGAFKRLGQAFGLGKLHPHSHLYTSKNLVSNFPGRSFKIIKTIPSNKREIRKLAITKANITVRNFSENVDSLRKKHNIREGGENYLFFTTDMDNKRIAIHCTKL